MFDFLLLFQLFEGLVAIAQIQKILILEIEDFTIWKIGFRTPKAYEREKHKADSTGFKMDIPEIIWEIFLRLPYREIIRLRSLSSSILNMTRKRLFWEEKSILDFGSSIRSLEPKNPEESYIFMMAENGIIDRGVERYLPIEVCLQSAFHSDNLPLLQHFVSFTSPADRRFFLAFLNEWEEVLPLCASSDKSLIQMVAYYLGKEGKTKGLDILIRSHITYTDIIVNSARSGAEKAKRKKMLSFIDKYRGKNLFSLIFS